MKIVGVVLAGGLSSRMGEDKALLQVSHCSLLSRAVSLLHNAGLSDCFVSGEYVGFECIKDKQPLLGPIAGLSACAQSLHEKYDAMFVIPVDMPLLAVEDCHYLLNQVNAERGVYYSHATFPMILPLNATLLDYLNEAMLSTDNKQRSIHRLLTKLNYQSIMMQDANAFRFENTNTPVQWAHCLSMLQSTHN